MNLQESATWTRLLFKKNCVWWSSDDESISIVN